MVLMPFTLLQFTYEQTREGKGWNITGITNQLPFSFQG